MGETIWSYCIINDILVHVDSSINIMQIDKKLINWPTCWVNMSFLLNKIKPLVQLTIITNIISNNEEYN